VLDSYFNFTKKSNLVGTIFWKIGGGLLFLGQSVYACFKVSFNLIYTQFFRDHVKVIQFIVALPSVVNCSCHYEKSQYNCLFCDECRYCKSSRLGEWYILLEHCAKMPPKNQSFDCSLATVFTLMGRKGLCKCHITNTIHVISMCFSLLF